VYSKINCWVHKDVYGESFNSKDLRPSRKQNKLCSIIFKTVKSFLASSRYIHIPGDL
jgi:hypothetical protein